MREVQEFMFKKNACKDATSVSLFHSLLETVSMVTAIWGIISIATALYT